MKKLLYFIIGVLTLSVNAQDRALLIGISNYQAGTGWGKIHSHNDIALLQRVLPNTCKITTLCNSEATYQGIINAIDQLIQETHFGEQVLFHFSGHGQQMLTNDPNEPDLLDEALIPYDAPMMRTSMYRGECHLIDNQLDSLITLLRTKAGHNGLVVVSLDACHSGDSNRGGDSEDEEYTRGTSEIFGLDSESEEVENAIYKNWGKVEQTNLSKEDIADVAYISACQPHLKSKEIERESTYYGPLTYAISKAYASHSFSSIREWLHSIEKYMQHNIKQEPYIIDTLE